jgi:hypothetical protein
MPVDLYIFLHCFENNGIYKNVAVEDPIFKDHRIGLLSDRIGSDSDPIRSDDRLLKPNPHPMDTI